MANKDLFKQAIADAKSVREAAIANAKETLEETLTPHLKDMLAAKLQEMEDAQVEDVVNEDLAEEEVEITEEEVLAEGDGLNAVKEGDYAKDEAADVEDETEDDSEESEDEVGADDQEHDEDEKEVEDDGDLKDLSVEDFKDIVRDIIAQEMGGGEELDGELDADLDGGEELPLDTDAADAPVDGDEELIDLDELLAELEAELSEGEESKDETVEEGEDKHEGEKVEESKDETVEEGEKVDETTEEVDEALTEAPATDLLDLIQNPEALKILGMYGAGLFAAIKGGMSAVDYCDANPDNKICKMWKSVNKDFDSAKKRRDDVYEEEGTHEGSELNEALETIKNMKADLNEVNLLNAKLLYVNKIFKSQNLTESQKVNVIASFDKADSVKEVKLVFETVSETFTTKQPASSTIKEHKGSASKATGNSTKPEVISEVSDAVLRMQKLAGII